MVSIVIPTRNRPSYLKRILGYYSDYEVTYNIIVADSSSGENKKLNEETISSFSNLEVQHLDNYSSEINPYCKLADALNYANTKFCVFCADDDFITPNGINQSIDFLEKNPDFAVAHGRYISFYLKDDERGKRQFSWNPVYSHESIIFSDPMSRLSHHLSNYLIPTFYAVHRTEYIKMIFEETLKAGLITVGPLSELVRSTLALIYGKMKCLDVLYAARDGDSIRVEYWPTLRDAVEAVTYGEEYAKFRDCLSIHLSKQSQLDMEESRKLIDNAMAAYIKKHNTAPIRKAKKRAILDFLHLPDWMERMIIMLYSALFIKPSPKLLESHNDFNPLPKDYDDFNKIRLHVLPIEKQITKHNKENNAQTSRSIWSDGTKQSDTI